MVAVVRAADGVRFVAMGSWDDDVAPALLGYVEERADHVLWPSEAARVRELIAADQLDEAIAEYFMHVGSRWDDECLESTSRFHHDDREW
jgi:hypothetical protein